MVVPGRDFLLERVYMLICQNIRRTIHGRGVVIIEDTSCSFVAIMSDALIQRLLAMAQVKEWYQVHLSGFRLTSF